MASSTTATQRATITSPPPAISPAEDESKNPTRKNPTETPNIATIKNLGKFSPHYAFFIWTVLFMTLVWNDFVLGDITYAFTLHLLSVTMVSILCLAMMLTLPEVVILYKRAADKRLVWFLLIAMLLSLFVATVFELVVMQGEMFLFWAFTATVPIILLHASLMSRGEELPADVDQTVQEKGGTDNLPGNMV